MKRIRHGQQHVYLHCRLLAWKITKAVAFLCLLNMPCSLETFALLFALTIYWACLFFIWTWVIFVRYEIHMKPFYSPNRYWFLVWNKCSYNSQIAQYASFVWVLLSMFKATSRYPLCFTYFGSGFCLFKYSHVVYNTTKR